MTVQELVQALDKLPKDAPVYINDFSEDWRVVEEVELNKDAEGDWVTLQ